MFMTFLDISRRSEFRLWVTPENPVRGGLRDMIMNLVQHMSTSFRTDLLALKHVGGQTRDLKGI